MGPTRQRNRGDGSPWTKSTEVVYEIEGHDWAAEIDPNLDGSDRLAMVRGPPVRLTGRG